MNQEFKGRNSTATLKGTPTSKETLFGCIRSEEECLQIIDMCRINVLPRVAARLTDEERATIRPGSIFVYEEEESGITRWTDGKSWSPSKISGQCLMYHELAPRGSGVAATGLSLPEIIAQGKAAIQSEARAGKPAGKVFSGLLKMTASVLFQGKVYHLISYTSKWFMEQWVQGSIWQVIQAWPVPPTFHLRMNYRRKRSASQLGKSYLSFSGNKDLEEKQTQSCPILSDILTSPAGSDPKDADDFFMDYLYHHDLYLV